MRGRERRSFRGVRAACDVSRRAPRRDVTLLDELIQQAAPLLSEQVGAGQAAVSADHTQVGDAALDEVVCGFQAALVGTKLLAACAADDGATLRESYRVASRDSLCVTSIWRRGTAAGRWAHHLQHAGDALPRRLLDVVSTVHHPLVPLRGNMRRVHVTSRPKLTADQRPSKKTSFCDVCPPSAPQT